MTVEERLSQLYNESPVETSVTATRSRTANPTTSPREASSSSERLGLSNPSGSADRAQQVGVLRKMSIGASLRRSSCQHDTDDAGEIREAHGYLDTFGYSGKG
eukprot:1373114-Prymnesium_polylepis.1